MGRRQRRRLKAAGATKIQRKELEPSGPYVVCAVCREPLVEHEWVYTYMGEFLGKEHVTYAHALEHIEDGQIRTSRGIQPYDHKPEPVESELTDAAGVCDFCHAPEPRWTFVPRTPILLPDPSDKKTEMDYSSPWGCCDGCLRAVKNRDLTRMLNRAMSSPHSPAILNASAWQLPALRAWIRRMYVLFIKSSPAGPYEIVQRHPVKVGKRSSRRGMLQLRLDLVGDRKAAVERL